MASFNPAVDFSFTYHGKIAKELEYAAIKEGIGKYSRVQTSVKALEQWIYTNPNNFKGITAQASKTNCTPNRVELTAPTNRTPKVYEFELATETCVKTLVYDQSGDFTHFQELRDTGMAGFRGLAGYQGIFASNISMGMANDNFERHWFANPANTAGSILDTAEMEGVWTQLIANSATTAGFGTAFQATDIGASPSPANIIATLDELIEGSYVTLQERPEGMKKFFVTPNVKYAVDAYLRDLGNSDANFAFVQNQGFGRTVSYRGIELIPVWGWQESLNQSIGATRLNDLGADTQYLILYTTTDNIWGLTDNVNI